MRTHKILITILLNVLFIFISYSQTTYYHMYSRGSGGGEFLGNSIAWLDYWGIQIASGNKVRATVSSDGKWFFFNPNDDRYSDGYYNLLNSRASGIPNLTIATQGNIGAKEFSLTDFKNSSDTFASIGFGRNGDVSISNHKNKWLRIGSTGGIALWGNDNMGFDDSPQFTIMNNTVTSNAPFSVTRGNIGLNRNSISLRFGLNDQENEAWIGTTSNTGMHLGANQHTSIYLDGNYGVYIGKNAKENIRSEMKQKYGLFVVKGILSEDYAIGAKDTWADYVLEDNYKLMNIKDLKTFIKSNKYLPGVPSAQDISKNGYSQHEMNKILLSKIEELTLYIISQEEKIRKLEKLKIK